MATFPDDYFQNIDRRWERRESCQTREASDLNLRSLLTSFVHYPLKGIWKLNNFGHDLFIFKILLIAIDWNF